MWGNHRRRGSDALRAVAAKVASRSYQASAAERSQNHSVRLAGRRSALLAGLAAALVGAVALAGTADASAAYHNARYTFTFPVRSGPGAAELAGPTAKQANAVLPGRIAPPPAHAGQSGAASGPGDPRREPLTVPQPFIPSDGQAPDRPGATGTMPAAPSRLAAKVAGSSVSLTWTNNATTPAATVVWIQRATNARFTRNWTDTAVRPAATSYTDKSAAAGTTYYYRVLAQNPAGNSPWSNAVSILVPAPPVGTAPAITSAAGAAVTAAAGGSFTITTTGSPAPALTVTGALPPGTAFTDHGDGTGTLQVPAGTAAGSYPVTLTATNSLSAATQAFTLTVGTAPAITSAASTVFTAAAGGSFTITTTGSPAPALTVTGALPPGTAFTDNGDGTATLQVPAGRSPHGACCSRRRPDRACGRNSCGRPQQRRRRGGRATARQLDKRGSPSAGAAV